VSYIFRRAAVESQKPCQHRVRSTAIRIYKKYLHSPFLPHIPPALACLLASELYFSASRRRNAKALSTPGYEAPLLGYTRSICIRHPPSHSPLHSLASWRVSYIFRRPADETQKTCQHPALTQLIVCVIGHCIDTIYFARQSAIFNSRSVEA
jgi:hypothetical protein